MVLNLNYLFDFTLVDVAKEINRSISQNRHTVI